MNIHEAQMYVNLVAAIKRQDLQFPDDFDDIVEELKAISIKRHIGNGYFSWDGILDDLAEMFGDEDYASEILSNC